MRYSGIIAAMTEALDNVWKELKSNKEHIDRTRERVAVAEARLEQHDVEFRTINKNMAGEFASIRTELQSYGDKISEFIDAQNVSQGRRQGQMETWKIVAWFVTAGIAVLGLGAAYLNALL